MLESLSTMEKNNTKSLVSGIDDDPTAELEILSHSLQSQDADDELEADANTYNCEDDSDGLDHRAGDIESLERGIRERDQSIARLQYDFEQLRSRWNGLDTEIKVREKLTDNLNAELRRARNDLAAMQKKVRDSQERAELLAIKESDDAKSAEVSSKLIESLRIAIDQRDQQVAELGLQQTRNEQQLDEMRAQFAAVQSESKIRVQEHAILDSLLRDASATLQQAEHRITTLSEQLTSKDAALSRQSAEMEVLCRQLAQSSEDLAKLQQIGPGGHAAASDALQSRDPSEPGPGAVQTGLLFESRQEVRELQSQVSRTEAYADSLRIKLQNQIRLADDAARVREQTDMALADARQRIAELRGELADEKLSSANLCKQLEVMRSEFEAELSRVQLELVTAQKTISDHEIVHEQLTADLFDSQSFRQVLESQLERTEESSETLIRTLRQKIKRLEHQHEDDRHKISNKDGAIAALLNELANRSSTAKVSSEMEGAAPDEPGIEPDIRHDDKSVADRTTRLLIGNVDGQELRFPLFKDKLTIGRTRNNDIHLKAQFISRRHALIVTENDRTRIVDWGSKNGIAVNRQPVTEHVLRSGDIVTIGNADFRYEERPKR
jgi:chromosome segregation ATPase